MHMHSPFDAPFLIHALNASGDKIWLALETDSFMHSLYFHGHQLNATELLCCIRAKTAWKTTCKMTKSDSFGCSWQVDCSIFFLQYFVICLCGMLSLSFPFVTCFRFWYVIDNAEKIEWPPHTIVLIDLCPQALSSEHLQKKHILSRMWKFFPHILSFESILYYRLNLLVFPLSLSLSHRVDKSLWNKRLIGNRSIHQIGEYFDDDDDDNNKPSRYLTTQNG